MTNILFGDKRPDIIKMEDLYKPDDPDSSGQIIPSIGSILIETDDNKRYAYIVTELDPETNKSKYVPLSMVSDEETYSNIDYGNNKFFCFYDDRVNPIKINIDSLLNIFMPTTKEYRLRRKIYDTGEDQILSVYYDSDGNYQGDRIPMLSYTNSGYKYPSNCHTHIVLQNNETIYMDIFDSSGTQCAEIVLFSKRATISNTYDKTPIITDFLLEGNQKMNDGFYLYNQQDKSALNLTPTLVYNTGKRVALPIDNQVCYLYGFEDLVSSFPGLKQTIMCKYFLRTEQNASNAISNGNNRYVVVEKDIVILPNSTYSGIKLAAIPKWIQTTQSYELRFWAYTVDKTNMVDVTDYVTILNEYDLSEFNRTQKLECMIDLKEIFDIDDHMEHVQNIWIRLNHPSTGTERYILKDAEITNIVYGVDSSSSRRPIVHYDDVRKGYFISTNRFGNKEAFLESFYYNSNPPYDVNIEIGPIEPTHFIVRDLNTNSVVSSPLSVDEYLQIWYPVINDDPSRLVGNTIVIEFLKYEQDEYKVIYGVPVDVYTSPLGYQG